MSRLSSSSSSLSSIDSSKYPPSPSSPHNSSSTSSAASICISSSRTARRTRRNLYNDLYLGFSDTFLPQRGIHNWPSIKPIVGTGRWAEGRRHRPASLFVKVYMEGVPIGRKLDLLCHNGYGDLSETLAGMFKTSILCPNGIGAHSVSEKKQCVLTYEDEEGDWMMVGDVPWEVFTSTVKRLKITRAERC